MCACVLLFALIKLFSCNEQCQVTRGRERARAAGQAEYARLHPNKTSYGVNESNYCPGVVVEDRPAAAPPTQFNPNNCAFVFNVLEGRVLLGWNAGFFTAVEVGPEGAKEPIGMTQWVQAKPGTAARWKFLLCNENRPAMKEWRCN